MEWKDLHKRIFEKMVIKFNDQGVRFFILRNYQKLPNENLGKDLDLIIQPGSYSKCTNILVEILKDEGIQYYTVSRFDKMRCWYIMDMQLKFAMHIDLIEQYLYKGVGIFEFDELYANTFTFKNFKVLNEPYDSVMLLVQNIIAYSSLKEKYRWQITETYKNKSEETNRLIIQIFGKKYGLQLINFLKIDDYDSIIRLNKVLSRVMRWRDFKKQPINQVYRTFRFLLGKFYRIIWCPNKFRRFIAVLGPDGVGKTTFLEALVRELAFYYVSDENRFVIRHFRPTILPNLAEIGEKVNAMEQDINFSEPHRAKPVSFISSLLRFIYYWLDYFIGVNILIRKDVQYERYTIFDRYIYDFIVDPYRSRIKLPYFIRLFFSKLVPAPEITFILQADKEIIFSRKQELNQLEIERQLSEGLKLSNTNNRFVLINTSENNPKETAGKAVEIIMKKFMKKV